MGNCIATAVVARWEGVFDDERMRGVCARTASPGSPDADRGGRRARAARRGRRPRMPRRGHEVIAFDHARARRHRRSRGGGRDGARRARTSSSTARRTTTSTAPRIIRSRRSNANAFGVRALARGGADARRRRSSTTAPISCSTARRRRPTPKTMRRIRGASTRCRSCSASGSRATRRAPTCCGSRVCSAARPARRPAKGSVAGILNALQAGQRAECLRGPHDLADLRRSTWRARRGSCWSRRRRAGLYHCVNTGIRHLARVRAGDWPGCSGIERAADAGAAGRHEPARRRVRSTARCRTRSCASLGIDMPTWQDALAAVSEHARLERFHGVAL